LKASTCAFHEPPPLLHPEIAKIYRAKVPSID